MRIALTCPQVELGGGVERALVETANRIARAGHETKVFAARVAPGVLAPEVATRMIPVPARLDASVGVGFRRPCTAAVREWAPDVHGAFSALCPLGGVYWVPSVHRVAYELLQSRRSGVGQMALALHPYHRVRLSLERSMCSAGGAVKLLALAPQVADDVRRCYPDAPPLEVLPYGYDDGTFNARERATRRDRARRLFGFAPEDRVLAFVANELERKGFDVLLKAIERIPQARVLGAGRVAPSPALLAAAPAGDRVRWAGHSADVAEFYAAADAFVLPTRYEAWGLVIVEALGSGLPVVTSRLAGAASAVREDQTGRLLEDPEDVDELEDAIRWSISDRPADADTTSRSVGDLSWDRIVDRYLAVLSAS
jgi:UDP-glucose:(heptosyl)LPS alpha-1,3-glucosyltransferase